MRTGKSDTHGLSIDHYLLRREWPRPITEEEYPWVIERIQRGDLKIIEWATLSFIPLLGLKVTRYCAKLKTQRFSDDLMSAGLHGIVDAVDRIRNDGLGHENLGGYVVSYMHNYMSHCVQNLAMVRVPGSTIRTWKQEGRPLPARIKTNLLQTGASSEDTSVQENELLEVALSVCYSADERRIVELRMLGMTDAEISEAADVTRSSICKTRQQIGDRLREKLETEDV